MLLLLPFGDGGCILRCCVSNDGDHDGGGCGGCSCCGVVVVVVQVDEGSRPKLNKRNFSKLVQSPKSSSDLAVV